MPFDPLKRQKVGDTELTVTRMGLGCAPLGTRQVKITDSEADSIVQGAYLQGIRHFDTSPWYGQGKSELRVGRNLVCKSREDLVISTKVGRVFFRPANPKTFNPPWLGEGHAFDFRWDYSYDGVMRSYEDSLLRLGMNRVDMLFIHDIDPGYHGSWENVDLRLDELDKDGGYRALEELKNTGEIKAIGAGINVSGLMPRYLERFEIDCFLVAMPYTLLDQDVLQEEFPLLVKHNSTAIIGSVFASGILATGPHPDAKYDYKSAPQNIQEKVVRMQEVSNGHSVSLKAAALQFPLANPQVSSIIPGALLASQVAENLSNLKIPIPKDFWEELKSENLIRQDAPTPD